MALPRVCLALANYDRHAPFFSGEVTVDGIDLEVLEVGENYPGRHGVDVHTRMLRDAEFDAAECSLASYVMAREQGAAFTAIPVFPRRFFSLTQAWCRRDTGVAAPADLVGRRVGIYTYQTTLSVLFKADLQRCYGVDWRQITWVTSHHEVRPFDPPPGVRVEALPPGRRLADALDDGDVQAVLLPNPPAEILDHPERFQRLIPDAEAEGLRYFRDFGYWPVMHPVAIRAATAERLPGLPRALYDAFELAWARCRRHWEDPNWSWLVSGSAVLERQRHTFGRDVWPNGLAANRANVEWFVEQVQDQGLIRRRPPIEELFAASVLDT